MITFTLARHAHVRDIVELSILVLESEPEPEVCICASSVLVLLLITVGEWTIEYPETHAEEQTLNL
jgi:hypothetical protein